MLAAVHQPLGGNDAQIVQQYRIRELVDAVGHSDLGTVDESILRNSELTDEFLLLGEIGIAHEKHVEPLAKLDGLAPQLRVGELLELRLERRDVGGLLLQPLHAPPLAEA